MKSAQSVFSTFFMNFSPLQVTIIELESLGRYMKRVSFGGSNFLCQHGLLLQLQKRIFLNLTLNMVYFNTFQWKSFFSVDFNVAMSKRLKVGYPLKSVLTFSRFIFLDMASLFSWEERSASSKKCYHSKISIRSKLKLLRWLRMWITGNP